MHIAQGRGPYLVFKTNDLCMLEYSYTYFNYTNAPKANTSKITIQAHRIEATQRGF